MTSRNEMISAFTKIMTLASKIDANQQKVNFMWMMSGRVDDAHHWQAFVDNQRARIEAMHIDFALMTSNLTAEEVNEIKMECFNKMLEGAGQ